MQVNSVTSKNTRINNAPAFTARPDWNLIKKSITDGAKNWHPKELFEPGRAGNMTRNLFTLNAFIFLLGGRLVKSRDPNEKRETLTRDIPTILLAVFGVPLFEKRLAAVMQTKTGFALLQNPHKYSDGIIDADMTKDLYHMRSDFKPGIKAHLEKLDRQGANLKRVLSFMSDEIKQGVASFSENNKEFMDKILHNESKGLLDKVEKGFLNADNEVFKKANFMKSVPKLVGIASTLALIGICIPNLNIFITEMVNRNKKPNQQPAAATGENLAAATQTNTVQNASSPAFQQGMKNAFNSSSDSKQKAFSKFLN